MGTKLSATVGLAQACPNKHYHNSNSLTCTYHFGGNVSRKHVQLGQSVQGSIEKQVTHDSYTIVNDKQGILLVSQYNTTHEFNKNDIVNP